MIRCALCDATADNLAYARGNWRTVALVTGSMRHHICPAHWPETDDPAEWEAAYKRVFEQLRQAAAAKEVRCATSS